MKMSILNVDNYLTKLSNNQRKSYFNFYFRIINDYTKHIIDRVIGNYDNEYYKFIIMRGAQTLKHIFINLLTYTKNINLTIHHCDKSTLYYVEFIEQIGNDNNSYLKLNSTDATLFVYKKTIFDINNEARKNLILTENEKQIIKLMECSSKILNMFLNFMLKTKLEKITDIQRKNPQFKADFILYTDKNLNKIFKILNNIFDAGDINSNIHNTNIFLHFLELIFFQRFNQCKIIKYMRIFFKKIIKKEITIETINKKMLNNDCNEKLLKHNTFVKWLYQ